MIDFVSAYGVYFLSTTNIGVLTGQYLTQILESWMELNIHSDAYDILYIQTKIIISSKIKDRKWLNYYVEQVNVTK